MPENILLTRSVDFAAHCQAVLLSGERKKERILSKQILRSDTSIGANINKAQYGNSKADCAAIKRILTSSINTEKTDQSPTTPERMIPMSDRKMKKVSSSATTQVQLLTAANLNGYHRLFGGQLMSWMDIVAGVTARRHSGRNVTTLRVDGMVFHKPAHANDTLVLQGEIVYVGRTSMTVRVRVYVEELTGEQILINEASFVMVALDDDEKPTEVPGLLIETQEQQEAWDKAAQMRKLTR